MKLKCCSFEEFKHQIESRESRILMFGAGMIGQVIVPQLLNQMGLLSHIDGYVDNDKSIWNSSIIVEGRTFPIYSPEQFLRAEPDSVILINLTRFASALKQIEQIDNTGEMDCYVMPMLLVHNYCLCPSKGIPIMEAKPVIPRKLHYMWLGKNKIPKSLQKCIDSWKRFCPDFEIIEWNESNYDVSKHPYMKEAYERGAYGFVPDYARLDILYKYGGIYMDTDVELVRSLEPMLYQEAFCCMEKWQDIAFGGGCGAVQGNKMIKKFLDARQNIRYITGNNKENRTTCGFYDTRTALENGYIINGETQNICGMNIYAYDYFLPYDYMTGQSNVTEHTYSIHWYNGGWLDEQIKKSNEMTKRLYMDTYQIALGNQQY